MRRKLYPINTLARAKHVGAAWELIGPTITFANFTNRVFHNEITQVEAIELKIRNAEIQLAALRNERDSIYMSLWDKVKRMYAGVNAAYGDDSVQYEMVGRTRSSKRKRRAPKSVSPSPREG
jgi:hypothetical protein